MSKGDSEKKVTPATVQGGIAVIVGVAILVVILGSDVLSNRLYAFGIIALLFLVLTVVLVLPPGTTERTETNLRKVIDEITDIVAIVAIAAIVALATDTTVPGDLALGGIVSVALGKRVLKLRNGAGGSGG